MDQDVKFIFKTLMKVPVFIFVSYVIFNLFAFAISYFRMLSLADMVMQVAVENNYLPPQELNTLSSYINDNLESGVLTNIDIVTGLDGGGNPIGYSSGATGEAQKRKQYGCEVTCGVTAEFVIQWPLMPHQQVNDYQYGTDTDSNTFSGSIPSSAGDKTVDWKDDSELEIEREKNISRNNINIVYTVPGLKYYPDLIW